MTEQFLASLLSTIEIAAFERTPDGSFTAAAPIPRWFGDWVTRHSRFSDTSSKKPTSSGPRCDRFSRMGSLRRRRSESGQEFHYKVTAVTLPSGSSCCFSSIPQATACARLCRRYDDPEAVRRAGGTGAWHAGARSRRAADEIRATVLTLEAGVQGEKTELPATLSNRSAELVQTSGRACARAAFAALANGVTTPRSACRC